MRRYAFETVKRSLPRAQRGHYSFLAVVGKEFD